MSRIAQLFRNVNHFLEHDLWKIDVAKLPLYKRLLAQSGKVIFLAYKGFADDKVKMRASALTFFSLLSIVPILAMAFGIAQGFGLDKELERQLINYFQGQEEILQQSLAYANNLLSTTRGGLIAGVGVVLLIYSVMELLQNIERSFNDIWYINKERPLVRKFTDYLAIMIFAPVLLVISNSLTVFISSEIERLTETVELIGLFKGLIFPVLRLLPYMVIWILFSLLYVIMPNTKVKLQSAIIAGIMAGSAFLITEWAVIQFQVNVSEYNAIYGSFSILPLFLVWLQLSWLIVLFGAELSYAIQNIKQYEYEKENVNYSYHNLRMASLLVMNYLSKNFAQGKGPSAFPDLLDDLKIPHRYLQHVLNILVECKLASEVVTKMNFSKFLPAVDVNTLTPVAVIERLNEHGENDPIYKKTNVVDELHSILEGFEQQMRNSDFNKLLKDL